VHEVGARVLLILLPAIGAPIEHELGGADVSNRHRQRGRWGELKEIADASGSGGVFIAEDPSKMGEFFLQAQRVGHGLRHRDRIPRVSHIATRTGPESCAAR
jgi:hypothetical protein